MTQQTFIAISTWSAVGSFEAENQLDEQEKKLALLTTLAATRIQLVLRRWLRFGADVDEFAVHVNRLSQRTYRYRCLDIAISAVNRSLPLRPVYFNAYRSPSTLGAIED